MKTKKSNRSTLPPTTPNSSNPPPQPPPYHFVPQHIPFYPPPHHTWSAFPCAWPVPPPGPPPSGFPITIPPQTAHPSIPQLNGKPSSSGPLPPPYGLWPPPPGAFPPPPMMMGPVMPPMTTSAQGPSITVSASMDLPSQPAPPLRRRPVTRRLAAQDRAASAATTPDPSSSVASKGSQTRRVKSKKSNAMEDKISPDQDKSEANIVDEQESLKEGVSTAETSDGEENNAPLPKLGSEPYVSLRFGSEDEAYEFYNAYAKEKGFSIRKSHIQRSRVDRSVISREYVCANQGFRSPNDRRYKGKVVRPRRETRVDCRAAMSIKKRSGRWVVDRFHKEHNHGLVDPAKAEKLRSHRKITSTTKSVIDALYKCRIGPSKIIDVITKAVSGENRVEISGLDLMKYVKKERKNNIIVDCYRMLEYFQGMQAVDPGFFYAIEVGENRSMRSMFWADSRAREAYKQFGDVLVFDTICRTNKDLFPFSSFTGVNHHRQAVLIGCGLLADETVESFIWLFETFLRAMSNRCPTSIITNLDKAMMVAVEKVFPKTRHRFCMWHIEKIELENLSDLFSMHPDFQTEYRNCIYDSLKAEEFESGWKAILAKYNLKENNWLKGMYDQRHHWVPLYLKDTFFAGMTTTRLGQGLNYFDGFLHEGTPVNEFVSLYEQTIKRRREEEADEDFLTMYASAVSTSKNLIEEQAARVYTRNMFTVFGQEFFESCGCIARKISNEEHTSKYLVGKYGDKDDQMNIVTFNSIDSSAKCSCQMFEFVGILCKHVLKVFQDVNVLEIPPKYILKRWTMNARYAGSCNDEVGGTSQDPTTANVWTLKGTAIKFVELGASSTERTKIAVNIIEEGLKKLSLINIPTCALPPENLGCDGVHPMERINDTNTTSCDPPPVKTKDRPSSTKIKLGIKQVPKKKRKCSTCKKTGHYTSTCPKGSVNHSHTSTNVAGTC